MSTLDYEFYLAIISDQHEELFEAVQQEELLEAVQQEEILKKSYSSYLKNFNFSKNNIKSVKKENNNYTIEFLDGDMYLYISEKYLNIDILEKIKNE